MSLSNLKSIVDAYTNGRHHTQYFFKNAGTTGDGQWHDWSYASGKPAYDARIGSSNQFTPSISSNNDAIHFPQIPSDMERKIARIAISPRPGGNDQVTVNFVLYDLVGYYPLIDGDSTDSQEFGNTLTLPRYTSGNGIYATLVNHVSPIVTNGNATIEYVNSNDEVLTSTFGLLANGLNKIVVNGTTVSSNGQMYIPTVGNGVKMVNNIIFNVAPGGLYSLYLLKPLISFVDNSGLAGVSTKDFTELEMNSNGWKIPTVYDGATLGMFFNPSGGTRTVAPFGEITFIWG